MVNKNWNLIKLFESVNGTKVNGVLKEQEELNAQLNEIDWSGEFADVKKTCIPPEQLKKDLNDVLQNRASKPKDRTKITLDKPLVHGGVIQQDEDGDIDVEQLINDITKMPNEKLQFNSPMALDTLKQRLADKYGVDRKSIITYDKLLTIPEGKQPIWNVIVMPSGDGDVSAQRQDVRITFLLAH